MPQPRLQPARWNHLAGSSAPIGTRRIPSGTRPSSAGRAPSPQRTRRSSPHGSCAFPRRPSAGIRCARGRRAATRRPRAPAAGQVAGRSPLRTRPSMTPCPSDPGRPRPGVWCWPCLRGRFRVASSVDSVWLPWSTGAVGCQKKRQRLVIADLEGRDGPTARERSARRSPPSSRHPSRKKQILSSAFSAHSPVHG